MNVKEKISHPIVSGGLIVSIIGLSFMWFKSINAVENQVNTNTMKIYHETEMRVSSEEGFKEDLKELKQDTKDIKQAQEAGQQKVESLLHQLLLRQAAAQPVE